MQRLGKEAARLFKILAGQDRDEPLGAQIYALYTILFVVALMLFAAWITGTPM